MSLSALRAVVAARAAIIKAAETAPLQNRCAGLRAYVVAIHLADRHRDTRGYVDDAVQQVTDGVGFDAKRALTVLHAGGVWVVVKHGNRRVSSWRGPGPVLVEHGAEPYVEPDDDEPSARHGQAPRAHGVLGTVRRPKQNRVLGAITKGARGDETSARGDEEGARGAQPSPSTVFIPRSYSTAAAAALPQARSKSSSSSSRARSGRPEEEKEERTISPQRNRSSSSNGDTQRLSPTAAERAAFKRGREERS